MKIKAHFRLFPLYIQKYAGSNSGMDMGYPGFTQSYQVNAWIVP
jgi:hypothetical protein